MRKKAYISHLAMILFGISTSAGMILIHTKVQSVSPVILAFYTFFFFVLFFALFSFKGLKRKITILKNNAKAIFHLNWTSLICWVATTVALVYLPTSLFLLIYLSSMMIAGLFVGKSVSRLELSCIAIIALGCLLALINNHANLLQWVMAFFAVIGGVTGAIYSKHSKELVNNFSSSEILALRFILLLVVTFIIALLIGGIQLESPSFYGSFILISILTVCLPLYLFQVGLKYINVYTALSYMPLSPCICLVYEIFTKGSLQTTLLSIFSVFLVSIAMIALCTRKLLGVIVIR